MSYFPFYLNCDQLVPTRSLVSKFFPDSKAEVGFAVLEKKMVTLIMMTTVTLKLKEGKNPFNISVNFYARLIFELMQLTETDILSTGFHIYLESSMQTVDGMIDGFYKVNNHWNPGKLVGRMALIRIMITVYFSTSTVKYP